MLSLVIAILEYPSGKSTVGIHDKLVDSKMGDLLNFQASEGEPTRYLFGC